MKILITGGAGFIGSAFVRMAIAETDYLVVNLDKLTYAGNLENLRDVENSDRYRFVHGDICDPVLVDALVGEERPDAIVHFAAESHVDRSILSPEPVVRTNYNGTFTMLEAAKRNKVGRFIHVSTDEVYGSLEPPSEADENYSLNPSSPYSSSKAASDLLARSYFITFKLPVVITRASNNYGPYQFPEKLIPLMITNTLNDQPLPVYGDGQQVRDWLYVDDHCRALRTVLERGRIGETYNVGGGNQRSNLEVVTTVCALLDELVPQSKFKPHLQLVKYVTDRPGHDRRYAIDARKLEGELGWRAQEGFETGLRKTVEWYLANAA